uniref:TLE family member 4, transcriptional corepressor n=1 Tax=Sus scrofa TaxID=9823 RepID=A0A8D0UMQ3_PIG
MIRDLSKMYPQTRHPAPHQPAQPFKFTISESCDRIKEEFQFLQAQYHSLKLECEKLASEKTEMQRHYVMYYEMSYGLNIEMHKQAQYLLQPHGSIQRTENPLSAFLRQRLSRG